MKPLVSLLSLALALPSVCVSQEPAADGFQFVKSAGGISEYRSETNDLNVLLMEDHSAPVLTFMVTYRVGSRNEVTGTTGATHLLEHLMFKGSTNFHPGIGKGFDTLMDRAGAINNATTWLDRTNYYENLPSDQLELAVQLEADRMRNLLLREEDRRPEMTVVRNEFEQDENDPASALDKEVTAAAFLAHPYHHPTIGWRSDIEKVTIEKLREFYDTFYWPDNATVTVIGDFQPEAALQLIQQYFGEIPRSPDPIPEVYTEEPAQSGPRRVVVQRPGEVGVVQVAYKAPPAMHDDHAALEVLATVLSDGKTSRLYRALIDTNEAIQVSAAKGFFRDQTLFNATILLAPGVSHAQAENTLLSELEKVKTNGVEPAEVERAVNKLLANIAYGRDGSFAIAGQLNETIAVGDWTLYVTLPEKLAAVQPSDLQRVAKSYVIENQSTTGWFIPLEESREPAESARTDESSTGRPALANHEPQPPAAAQPAGSPEASALAGSPEPSAIVGSPEASATGNDPPRSGETLNAGSCIFRVPVPEGTNTQAEPSGSAGAEITNNATDFASRVLRRKAGGMDVLTLKTTIDGVVTIRGALHAGKVFNPPENSAIADLTAGMLDKGTLTRDKFAVAELLEQTGAAIHFHADSHVLNLSVKALRPHLPLVLELLVEQLRTPRFDGEELTKLKKQIAGQYKRQMEDTGFRAQNAFSRAVFPAGHPNRPPADEQYLADIEAATLEQLKEFHAAQYGPAHSLLVAVGDVDDEALDQALGEALADWQGGLPLPSSPKAPALTASKVELVNMPGKASVSVVIGQPSGLRSSDAAYQPLHMATSVLGGGFFSARLLDIIRNREGLTYGIVALLGAGSYCDGAWSIRGAFAPELLDQGLNSTIRELQRFHEAGLTAGELETFKTTLTGSYKVALSTTAGLASALFDALQSGREPAWLDEYPLHLQTLTLEEVNAAVQTVLDPATMVIVKAGSLPGTENEELRGPK